VQQDNKLKLLLDIYQHKPLSLSTICHKIEKALGKKFLVLFSSIKHYPSTLGMLPSVCFKVYQFMKRPNLAKIIL
jgi:hypothetical protein